MTQSLSVDFPHKVFVPQPPAHLVARSRLTESLSVITQRRLITLTAPAGYGKTSLLIDFARNHADMPVCWYTLDQFDQDPWVFLTYLVAAIGRQFPAATEQVVARLTGAGRPPFTEATAALARGVYTIEHDFVLVIDDWHLVDHVVEIRNLISQLLLQCPRLRCILASRVHPGLPNMMLLTARRETVGIEEDSLRFTPSEASAVLTAEYQTSIEPDKAEALVERANGWITGILLAMQATGPTRPASVPDEGDAERHVYRFLAEQVFDQQPPDIQAFLLDAALLEDVTPEQCDAIFERDDSGALLEWLMRRHLFISEIKRDVFRYHPLFREFLLGQYRTSNRQRYRAMSVRVANAYAEQEQWAQAFDLCITSGDVQAAQAVLLRGGEQLYTRGRLDTLERCFAALTLNTLSATLLCLKARVLLDRGRHGEAQALADLAEARMTPEEQVTVLLLKARIGRVTGQYIEGVEAGQRVLELTQDEAQRAWALHMMSTCYHRLGQVDIAVEKANSALSIERQRGDLYSIALIHQDLGVYYHQMGKLRVAEESYGYADAYWAAMGHTGRRALSLNSKGVVQHAMGRYTEASETLIQALKFALDAAVTDYQSLVQVSLGDLYSDLRLWRQAYSTYASAKITGGTAFLISYLELAVIRSLVRQRQFGAANQALQGLPETILIRQETTVWLLRSVIHYGLRNYTQASVEIKHIIEHLQQSGEQVELAQAYLIQAQIVAATRPTDTDALIAALDRAAAITEQLGHDAFLIAEAASMRNILRRAESAGWARATDWLERIQYLHTVAQTLDQDDDPRPTLVVRTMGAEQMILNGELVEVGGWLKAREVLYYLLANPNGATYETLQEAIWPELGTERSRSVKDAIYQLRSALPRDLIEMHGRQLYKINHNAARIDYDVERFLELCDTRSSDPDALLDAVDLYRGAYLPWSDNEWSGNLRAHLEQRYLHALRVAAAHYDQAGAYADALDVYRRILAIDELDEAAHAGVMRCQMQLGNRAAAINQYMSLQRTLDKELGLDVERASEVEQLYRRILSAP